MAFKRLLWEDAVMWQLVDYFGKLWGCSNMAVRAQDCQSIWLVVGVL